MNKQLIAVLMGVMGLLSFIPVESSFAGPCAATTCTLDTWNIVSPGDSVTVTSTGTTLTFTFNDALGAPDYKSMKTIGWNGVSTGDLLSITPNGGNPIPVTDYELRTSGGGGPYSLAGFGSFSTVYDLKTPIGAYTYPKEYTFTFTSVDSLLGATFAVHAQYATCSGWVGNGSNANANPTDNPCGSTSVPEPASLLLLGSGLVGLGLWRRKMRSGAQA